MAVQSPRRSPRPAHTVETRDRGPGAMSGSATGLRSNQHPRTRQAADSCPWNLVEGANVRVRTTGATNCAGPIGRRNGNTTGAGAATPRRLAAVAALAVTLWGGTVPHAGAQTFTFTHLAGSTGGAGAVDGTGSAARFASPAGAVVDALGNIFVADQANHVIRKVTPAGAVTTFVGAAGVMGSMDGTGAAARFNSPTGLAIDTVGVIYVADSDNCVIRTITPAGDVATLAGTPGSCSSVDGTGAAARFHTPDGVAADSGGTVYVADTGNNTIRRITTTGVVTTLAGLAGSPGTTDRTGSAARFDMPWGIAVDASGSIFVSDFLSHTIRTITQAGVVTTFWDGWRPRRDQRHGNGGTLPLPRRPGHRRRGQPVCVRLRELHLQHQRPPPS